MNKASIKLIECPRDAMQGIHDFIDTDLKAAYLNLLLKVGFDTLDFGSFVSPKAIPQLRDTKEVLSRLELSGTSTKLLAIIANLRGAEDAAQFSEISYLGFPFSISEKFQLRNTNSTIKQSLDTIKRLVEICDKSGKSAVVYLSMGFGNPYGDEWNSAIVMERANELIGCGVEILSLADTTGVSSPEKIQAILPLLMNSFKNIEIGVHLHSTPYSRTEKIAAAYDCGCRRFDSALKGFGGCPMAIDDLTGNIATEDLISFLSEKKENLSLDMDAWQKAISFSSKIFG